MIKVYFVSTPIGNLKDITYRAIEVLNEVDIILCEDTRHSLPLLKHYNISKPLISYHKFNETSSIKKVLALIDEGKKIAVISDAGTPCISDPGAVLVKALIANDIEYTLIGGVSALINAYVLSGFDGAFTFVGFLPERTSDKDKLIEEINSSNVLIFYSSVHNVSEDLVYLCNALGDRQVAVVKEISKLFETVYRGSLSQVATMDLRGEFVIVVDKLAQTSVLNELTIDEHINFFVEKGLSKMDAIKQVAKDRGVAKNEIYKLTLKN